MFRPGPALDHGHGHDCDDDDDDDDEYHIVPLILIPHSTTQYPVVPVIIIPHSTSLSALDLPALEFV